MKNTNAYIRYRALDACLRNRRRRFYFKDLLEAVNKALGDFDGTSISERQLYKDLEHMQRDALNSEADVEIKTIHDGHRVYYQYDKPNYSMFASYLTQEEASLLGNTIQLLSKFKGMPQFDWLDEAMARLKQTFQLDGTVAGMVSFAQNPDLEGLKWYGQLFDAIVHHDVLEIDYHRYGRPARKRIVHPYQLRQWNNRWYLVGWEKRLSERLPYVVLAIDRIDGVKVQGTQKFKEKPSDLDFDDYFYDIVGVSLNPESKPEKVMLKVGYPAVWYIESKPLHPSQRVVEEGKFRVEGLELRDSGEVESLKGSKVQGFKFFQLEVIPNEELVQQLLVYADQVEVLQPKSLREKLRQRAEQIVERNR